VTPQQVMSLLDNLYYRFDKLTERYSVYKVRRGQG
jgi:hypothetical protein